MRHLLPIACLSLVFSNCGTSPVAPAGKAELNTLEYSGKSLEYDRNGLLDSHPLDADEIRFWKHHEIHLNMDTLRLSDGRFELVGNDVVWESDSAETGRDRFKTFTGAYYLKGDSLYLELHQPEYFPADTLALGFADGEATLRYCFEMEYNDLNGMLESHTLVAKGKCPVPSVAVPTFYNEVEIRFFKR